jgi:hypothetical protein
MFKTLRNVWRVMRGALDDPRRRDLGRPGCGTEPSACSGLKLSDFLVERSPFRHNPWQMRFTLAMPSPYDGFVVAV